MHHGPVPDETFEARATALTGAQRVLLRAIVDRLRARGTVVTWRGGERIGTTDDGQPVYEMRYADYSEDALALLGTLGRFDLVVPFDWPAWMGEVATRVGAGCEPGAVRTALGVADAMRYVTCIVRSDRFAEGAFGAAIEDGSLLDALDVVLAT